MPEALNSLEQQILDYMVRYLRTHTYQPSIREIGEEFGIRSTKTVSEHLRSLDEKGYLQRDPSRSRGIRILGLDLSPQTLSVPCYQELPDDSGGFVSDGVEAYLSVDRRLGGAKGCYFVRAREERFAPLGIEEGTLLLIEPSASAEDLSDGDLVVIRGQGELDLARVESNGARLRFRPARSGDGSIEVEESGVTGRVTATYRRLDGAPVTPPATAH